MGEEMSLLLPSPHTPHPPGFLEALFPELLLLENEKTRASGMCFVSRQQGVCVVSACHGGEVREFEKKKSLSGHCLEQEARLPCFS